MELKVSPFEDRQSPVFCVCKNMNRQSFEDISEDIFIDLTGNSFLQIGTIAILAMISHKARQLGKNSRGTYLENSALGNYLKRMDFFDAQGISKEESFTRYPSMDNFLEITPIRNEDNNNELPSRLRSVVSRHAGIHESLIDALDYSFGEVIDNVENHARSEVGGYVAAQYYPKGKYVEFCVVDGGVGIVESLRGNSKYTNMHGDTLLLKAFEEGVGEQVGDAYTGGKGFGCGFGLTFTARFVKATGGKLWAVSHEHAAMIDKHSHESIPDMYYPGTVICARVPTKAHVLHSDLYKSGSDVFYSFDTGYVSESDSGDINDILW